MEYLFYALIGTAFIIICELVVFIIIDIVREFFQTSTNLIHIKMVKTGNHDFHLHTICEVKGLSSFPELQGQVFLFQEVTQLFVSKVLQYQLDDYFVMQKRLQSDIDNFCNILKQFGFFLHTIEYDNLDVDEETIADAYQAAKNLIKKNQPLVNYFINLNKEVDECIKTQH